MTARSRAAALAAALALSGLTACKPTATTPPPSQVVASVGDQEISLLQFNHALKLVGIPRPNDALRREITEKLIDRELAVRQALAEQLERTPEVLLQLEEVRRDVLARAYAERIGGSAPSPSDKDVADYYAQHPELFAQRRIFRVHEFVMPVDMPLLDDVKARFIQRQPLKEVIAWLREQKAGFNEQVVIRAAEQLPIEALPRLNAATESDTVFFETPRGIMAYTVLSTQESPISWENARPVIRDYLTKQAGKRAMDAQLKQLRANTRISYGAAFAPGAATPATPPATAAAPAAAPATAVSTAPATDNGASTGASTGTATGTPPGAAATASARQP